MTLEAGDEARPRHQSDGQSAKVSVLVLTYNHERFIEEALDSVLRQRTDFAFEIIVSEDCSTDGTRMIVERYAGEYPDVMRTMYSERNLNTNMVLERAILAAEGEYLATLDGDDVWTTDRKLQTQVDFLDANHDCAACFHDAKFVDESGADELAPPSVWRECTRRAGNRIGPDEITAGNWVPTCAAMVRRTAVERLPSWYEHAECGDWPLWITAARSGKLAFIDEVLGARRIHTGGYWTSQSRQEQAKGVIALFKKIEQDPDLASFKLASVVREIWELKLATLEGRTHAAEGLWEICRRPGVDARLHPWFEYVLRM